MRRQDCRSNQKEQRCSTNNLQVKPAKHCGFYTIYRRDELRTKERKIEMALTRKLLKGMGLTDEQVDTIIEAHTDTVDGLKADVSKYKTDAEKLPDVQKQLDDLKAAGDGGYKEKYEKEHSDFEAYKSGITAKESKAAKEKAVRAYFESKNITGANLDLAIRGCGEEMTALEMDGEKIKDTKSLDALIEGTYKGLVSKPSVRVDMGARLNDGGKAMTKDEIMKITDRAERRAAIAANMDLFRKED